jgi:pSer/pThr/pTyr-binding forkhead associated (FHA) protein
MPKIVVIFPDGKEETHDLREDRISLGRTEDNAICINDQSVSSRHAEFIRVGGDYQLKDLDSTNGTRVNGERISEHQLRDGDVLRFGQIEVAYTSEVKQKAGETKPLPEADKAEARPADESKKPNDFSNVSPFKKKVARRDPIGKGVLIFASVAALAALAAILQILFLSPPR